MLILLLISVLVVIVWVQVSRILHHVDPNYYFSKSEFVRCIKEKMRFSQHKQKPEITAESCILKERCGYYLDVTPLGLAVPYWLMDMDRTDPRKRELNDDDRRLKKNANKLGKNLCVLAYLSTYGYLEETFFEGYIGAEQDLEFQSRIISVYKKEVESSPKGMYLVNFANLICGFLERWDFAPEIKKIIFEDERFEDVRSIYNLFRSRETGELLKR